MEKDTIYKIVKSSGVTAGEIILVHYWGEDKDKTIANNFLSAIASIGATPFLVQQSRTINYDIFSAAEETCFDDRYFSVFSNFDAVLDVFVYQPVVLNHELDAVQTKLYRGYMSKLFANLMKCKRFSQIRVPTRANAEEADLAAEDFIFRMEKAYDIDYDNLIKECTNKQNELNNVCSLNLYTGTNCQLFFDFSGREWKLDAGDGDWPCGEVYIAPCESRTHGTVYFEKLILEKIGTYEQVTLCIENGSFISSNNKEVNRFFEKLPREDKVICELGFGMNPNITDLCGYTVLDEKMAGSFHIAIGANNMFGGENSASIHMDFVGNGTIEYKEERGAKYE